MTDSKHICRLETVRTTHICPDGRKLIVKNPACVANCPMKLYEQYVDEFNKKKAVNDAKKEAMEKRLEVLGLSANVIMDYDSYGSPMDFDEWREWEAGAEQRRIDALEQSKKAEEERVAENERRRQQNETNHNTFNTYLESLPKSYTPSEWRIVAKTLPIKLQPVPRGTKTVTCERNGSRIRINFKKE